MFLPLLAATLLTCGQVSSTVAEVPSEPTRCACEQGASDTIETVAVCAPSVEDAATNQHSENTEPSAALTKATAEAVLRNLKNLRHGMVRNLENWSVARKRIVANYPYPFNVLLR